jgi:hypothetical protein
MHGQDSGHRSPSRRQGRHIVMTDGVRIVTIPVMILSTPTPWAALCAMPA